MSADQSGQLRMAVLVSGGGTTLQNFIDCIAAGVLQARVALVVASKPGIVGIERARKANLPTFVVDRRATESAQFSDRIFSLCDEHAVELVCLGGWLSLLEIPARYAGRVMNIHPALLPSFGGRGLYGSKAHQAVIDHGCKVSGCTVHFVDGAYDNGPIILQRCCPVMDGDSADTLAHRVFEEEKIAYPEAVRLFQSGRLVVEGRRVVVRK